MQRTVGNQAIQRMFSSSHRTGSSAIQREVTAEAPETVAAPAVEVAASNPIAAPATDVPAEAAPVAGLSAGAPVMAAPPQQARPAPTKDLKNITTIM